MTMTPPPTDLSNLSMLEIFRMEVDTQVNLLNASLLAIEQSAGESDPGPAKPNDTALAKHLEVLMRAAHSTKGAARIVGLDPAVQVAHAMEDCFVAAQRQQLRLGYPQVDVLLRGVDWLTQLAQVSEANLPQWLAQQSVAVDQLVAAFQSLLVDATSDVAPNEIAPSAALAADLDTALEIDLDRGQEQPEQPEASLPETNPPSAQPITDRVVRVNADNLNRLMALAGESLVEVNWLQPFTDALLHLKRQQQQLTRRLDQLDQDRALSPTSRHHLAAAKKTAQDCHALLSDRLGDLDQFSRRFAQLSDNLYHEVIASHMRPFTDGTQAFPRMVRDLAKQLGKAVQLEIVGHGTQVDRDILEKLEAPLTHMLRNAVAHGIETPAQRRAAGKSETGTIRLEAAHRAGMLAITVSDDGRGMDLDRLRQKVVDKALTTAELAARLSETELLEFLFLPGFTTAETVTELAGRGVGLDIAKTMAQEVGGLLKATSQPGRGLTFHFQLPLTLSVIRALLVDIGGEPYAFNLARIDQVHRVSRRDIVFSENHPYIVVNDENVSLVSAQQVLGLPSQDTDPQQHLSVVLISDQTYRYGIVVDAFIGERDLVVRPLDPRLGKVQDISAAALTEDGHPLLIIDVADLVRSVDRLVSGGDTTLLTPQQTALDPQRQKHVLVVDDSITVREMERKLLQNQGYRVDVAVNGMEGWNSVRSGNYDLVISDIDMPRMNGIELVRQIKGHAQLGQLPVIIVSYKDRQADQLAGLEAGADYYLTKSSFHDNSLIEAVVDLIGEAAEVVRLS